MWKMAVVMVILFGREAAMLFSAPALKRKLVK
jgi:hypothetical protein